MIFLTRSGLWGLSFRVRMELGSALGCTVGVVRTGNIVSSIQVFVLTFGVLCGTFLGGGFVSLLHCHTVSCPM